VAFIFFSPSLAFVVVALVCAPFFNGVFFWRDAAGNPPDACGASLLFFCELRGNLLFKLSWLPLPLFPSFPIY
jgi:hypothetical protein